MIKNQIKNLSYSSNAAESQIKATIDPWILRGFIDGEGCFLISICRNKEIQIGWQVQLYFTIALLRKLEKDRAILETIQNYFGVGKVTKQGKNMFRYRVSSINDLKVILNHFDKYLLITQKLADYELFKQAILLIQNKEHLTDEGLRKIVWYQSMNWGLSE